MSIVPDRSSTGTAGPDVPRSAGGWRLGPFTISPAAAAVAGLLVMGLIAALANRDLPLVRNALLYAQLYENLAARSMKFWQVCSDPSLAFNKPCGFSMLAAPFVFLRGLNEGFAWTSFFGSALFVLSCWAFFKQFNRRYDLDDRAIPLEMLITGFNPLIIYQFWSAYSDSLFAAAFLWSFVLLDRMITERARPRDLIYYALALSFTVVVKHGGVMLFPLHALYLIWHHRTIAASWSTRRHELALIAGGLLLGLLFFVTGWLGLNPLLNLAPNKGQMDAAPSYGLNILLVLFFLVTTVSSYLLLLPAVRITRHDSALFAILLGNVFLLCLYRGSAYNARYYIQALPFVAPYLVRAVMKLRWPKLRPVLLTSFVLMNGFWIVVFNQRDLYRAVGSRMPTKQMTVAGQTQEMNFGNIWLLDNLRMGAHLETLDAIQTVNAQLPPGATLIYVSSYYGDGGFGVYEHSGYFRPDIKLRYTNSIGDSPEKPENSFDIRKSRIEPDQARGAYAFYSLPFRPRPLAAMEPLGARVYKVP